MTVKALTNPKTTGAERVPLQLRPASLDHWSNAERLGAKPA
jgi:hypothetical protein